MAEYIEREALLEAYDKAHVGPPGGARKLIEEAPAADVAPVVHGRWEAVLEGVWNLPTPVCVGWRCSECGREEQHKEPYCNCGARMDGE